MRGAGEASKQNRKEKQMKVANLTIKSGRKVENQFTLEDDNGREYFQSYDSIIAMRYKGVITIDPDYIGYSKTTSKWLYHWLDTCHIAFNSDLREGKFRMEYLNGQGVVAAGKRVPEWDRDWKGGGR